MVHRVHLIKGNGRVKVGAIGLLSKEEKQESLPRAEPSSGQESGLPVEIISWYLKFLISLLLTFLNTN